MFSVDRPKWFAFCNSIRRIHRRHSYYYYYCRVRAVRVRTGPRRQMWKWLYIYIYVCVQCALSGGDLISVKTGDPIGVKTHWQPCQSVNQTTSSCTSKYYTHDFNYSRTRIYFFRSFFFFFPPFLCLASCSAQPPHSEAATLACLLKLATASPWAPP